MWSAKTKVRDFSFELPLHEIILFGNYFNYIFKTFSSSDLKNLHDDRVTTFSLKYFKEANRDKLIRALQNKTSHTNFAQIMLLLRENGFENGLEIEIALIFNIFS